MAGAKLDDVVRRRSITIASPEQNCAHGEGPGWFKDIRSVFMSCRVASFANPAILVEVDALAVIGAHADIEWLGPLGSSGTPPS